MSSRGCWVQAPSGVPADMGGSRVHVPAADPGAGPASPRPCLPVRMLSGGLGGGRGGLGGLGEAARVVEVSPHLEAEAPGASYWLLSLSQ